MTRATLRLPTVLLTLLLAAAASADGLKPGPEHARLAAMVGSWDVDQTFTFQPGKPPKVLKGTSVITAQLGGLFIEERMEGPLGTSVSWTGFNTSQKLYEATRMASSNTIRIAESGSYDEKAGALVLRAEYPFAGDTWTERTVIRQPDKDTLEVDVYLGFGKVPEWKGVELRYHRKQ